MTETLLQIFFLGMMSRESENRDEKRENALELQAIKRSILFKKQYRREDFTF